MYKNYFSPYQEANIEKQYWVAAARIAHVEHILDIVVFPDSFYGIPKNTPGTKNSGSMC